MPQEDLSINQLRDPFNDVTRRTGRNLLASAVIGIIIVKVGLIPTKFNAFGIEFSQTNQNALLTLLALIIGYFLMSFIVYVLSEIAAWKLAFRSQEFEKFKNEKETVHVDDEGEQELHDFIKRYLKVAKATKVMFNARILVEVLVPIIVASYAIFIIINSDVTVLNEPNKIIQSAPKSGAPDG